MNAGGAEAAARATGGEESVRSRWTDAELLDLMLANAPQGMRPETMLPVLGDWPMPARTLVRSSRP